MSNKKLSRRVGRPSREERQGAVNADTDRRQIIVATSARLFADNGFDRTSIRDIAAAAGILSGSLYYYFKSKEDIFLEVHTQGMERLTEAVTKAIATETIPWDRLEALAAAHSCVLLESEGFMLMVAPHSPKGMDAQFQILMEQRNAYEKIIADVIAEIDFPREVRPNLFRLQLLGALNWAQSWYRPGGDMTPEEIGRHLVRTLRLSSSKTSD